MAPVVPMSRRFFLVKAGSLLSAAVLSPSSHAREPWTQRALPYRSYIDDATGARVYCLTEGNANNTIVYQTHPMWTPGMQYLLFVSDRLGGAKKLFALEFFAGRVHPLDTPPLQDFALAPSSRTLFGISERQLWQLDVQEAVQEGTKVKVLDELPAALLSTSGGMAVHPGADSIYVGATLEPEKRWGIFRFDVMTKTWRLLAELPFKVGHVQTNPAGSPWLSFCHETSGDAPQRIWLMDRHSGRVATVFPEQQGEWVTHEVWWGPREILFTVWPYDEARRKIPYGIAGCRLPTQRTVFYAQYPAWHVHGSSDRRWIMGDDFERNIWLIHPGRRERRLLSAGHMANDIKVHPHGSFTPDNRGVLINSSRFGRYDLLLIVRPRFEHLPPASA